MHGCPPCSLTYGHKPPEYTIIPLEITDNDSVKKTHNLKQNEEKFLDPSLYPDLPQKLMESILGREPSFILVL